MNKSLHTPLHIELYTSSCLHEDVILNLIPKFCDSVTKKYGSINDGILIGLRLGLGLGLGLGFD